MAICANCGKSMKDGAKFCPSCGTAAGASSAVPEKEKAGNITKCPNCGSAVPAMTAFCPDCGHEFRNIKTSNTVNVFFDKLGSTDVKEADSFGRRKTGTNMLHVMLLIALMAGTIILTLYVRSYDQVFTATGGVIVVIVTALFLRPKKVLFSEAETLRKGLIETFPIPNTKEDIIEFLVLASSHIVSANGFSYTAQKTRAWNRIWATKCRQVFDKAEISLAGNAESMAAVNGIRKRVEGVIRAENTRLLFIIGGAVAALVLCAAVFSIGFLGITIKVPESVTIAPEHVTLGGSFSDRLKVTGRGLTITTDKSLSFIKATIEVEALEDLEAVCEREFQKNMEAKGWDVKYCTYKLSRALTEYSVDISGKPSKVYFRSQAGSFATDLPKLKPGTPRVLTVFEANREPARSWYKPTPGAFRKEAAVFMARKEATVRYKYHFEVANSNPKNSDGGTWVYSFVME